MKEWFKKLGGFIAQGVIIAALVSLLQPIINRVLEPYISEKTLRTTNYLNAKRDAYYEAIEVLCRFYASVEWTYNKRVSDKDPPTETEINLAMVKLAMFSDNRNIVDSFDKCFHGGSPLDLGTVMNEMRIELGYGKSPIPPSNLIYLFKPKGDKK